MNTTTDVTTINSVLTFNGVATIDSTTVQKLKSESFSGTYSSTRDAYQTVSDSYVKNYGDQYHPTTEADTYLVFPLTAGAGWTISGTRTASVTSLESVTVAAGAYSSCFRVHMIFPPNATTDIWLAKNVGMVKSEAISINATDSTITTTELTSINF